jgi:DNA primase
MIFPPNFPDKIRSSILLSEVIAKKVKLKLKGKEFSGLCPFHNEKTPSFTVNDQKGFYHCFGCGAHGDIISFMISSEGLSFPEAIKKLAEDFSIEIPRIQFDVKKNDEINQKLNLLDEIKNFYQQNLLSESGKEAIIYLRNRGISNEIIKKFQLGFAINSYQSLVNFLKKNQIKEADFIESGVIAKNQQNNFYDKLRNRIIFPIFDIRGKVIAFGGRSLGDEMPKYLNSAETKLFKKNQTLYNLHNARKAIFDKGYAVIVEGYMDVIALDSAGFENSVAALGTALSQNHFKELFRFSNKIILCLDGDQAGIKAAARGSEIALSIINAKKNLFIATLPEKLDPDEYIKKYGAKNFTEILSNAAPLSEFLCRFSLIENKVVNLEKISAEKKAIIETDLNEKINLINDKTSKKHFSYYIKDWLYNLGRNKKFSEKKNDFPNLNKVSQHYPEKTQDKILAIEIISLIIRYPQLIFSKMKNLIFCN